MPLCALGLLALVIVQYIHEYISMWLWIYSHGYPMQYEVSRIRYRVCSYYHIVEMQYGKLDDDEESSEEPEPTDEEDRALILPNGGRERSGIGKCTDFLSISELRRADDDDPPEPCVRRIGLLLLRRLLRLLFEWCDATDMQSLSSSTGGGYCGMDVPISGSSIILCGCSTCSCC